MTEKIIIGLTGSFGSGCTTVSNILTELSKDKPQEYDFQNISISSILRMEAEKQGRDLSNLPKKEIRKILQDIGNDLREKDLGILIKKALEKVNFNKDIVIESIKNPGKIKELKKHPNSYIVALDANSETREKRILYEAYDGDKKAFEIDDLRERDEGIVNGQKLQECIDLADIIINNDKNRRTPEDEEEFKDNIIRYVKLMKKPGCRYPTDNELWMNNAYSLSLTSKCIKRKVGAIIVKNGYQIASGKNDVPVGEKSCKEVYKDECYRNFLRKTIKLCNVCGSELDEEFHCKIKSCVYNKNNLVKLLDKCRSLHAEENAILQSVILGGINLEGSIIFTTTFPCKLCANKIISVGIKEVVYVESYPDIESIELFNRHKKDITLTKFEGVNAIAYHKLFRE